MCVQPDIWEMKMMTHWINSVLFFWRIYVNLSNFHSKLSQLKIISTWKRERERILLPHAVLSNGNDRSINCRYAFQWIEINEFLPSYIPTQILKHIQHRPYFHISCSAMDAMPSIHRQLVQTVSSMSHASL